MLSFLLVCSWVASAHTLTVTWQDLPWPADQDWLGRKAHQPVTEWKSRSLQTGQDVLSVQSFTGPLTISYDVVLPVKSTTDGAFETYFVPLGESITQRSPIPDIELTMNESQSGNDFLNVTKDHGASTLWGNNPFSIATQAVYHVSISLAANGQVGWSINGNDVQALKRGCYALRQLKCDSAVGSRPGSGRSPTSRSFPMPATVTLLGAGLGSLVRCEFRRRKSSES